MMGGNRNDNGHHSGLEHLVWPTTVHISSIIIIFSVLISKSQHWHKLSDDEVQLLHRKQTKPALKNPEYMKRSPLNLQWSRLETQTGNHTALCTQQTHTNRQTHTLTTVWAVQHCSQLLSETSWGYRSQTCKRGKGSAGGGTGGTDLYRVSEVHMVI